MLLREFTLFEGQPAPPPKKKANIISGFSALYRRIVTKIKKKEKMLKLIDWQSRHLHVVNADTLFEYNPGASHSSPRKLHFSQSRKAALNSTGQKGVHRLNIQIGLNNSRDDRQNKPFLNTSAAFFRVVRQTSRMRNNSKSKSKAGVEMPEEFPAVKSAEGRMPARKVVIKRMVTRGERWAQRQQPDLILVSDHP